jgi:hypothetical protein
MSHTDKTDPFWVNVKLAEYHDHRHGSCTLPPKPTTQEEFDTQSWKRGKCYWCPADWHAVKFARPPKKWGHGRPWGDVRRDERLMVKEALAEALPPSYDEIIASLDEASVIEYTSFVEGPHSCRTCGDPFAYVGIDYCPEHREDD